MANLNIGSFNAKGLADEKKRSVMIYQPFSSHTVFFITN
jgi:hypothetical protein